MLAYRVVIIGDCTRLCGFDLGLVLCCHDTCITLCGTATRARTNCPGCGWTVSAVLVCCLAIQNECVTAFQFLLKAYQVSTRNLLGKLQF